MRIGNTQEGAKIVQRRLLLLALLLVPVVSGTVVAQTSTRALVGFSGSYSVFPTRLPVEYLSAVSNRTDVQGPARPGDAIGLSTRAGATIGERLSITGAFDFFATDIVMDVAATRTSADVLLYLFGVDALFAIDKFYIVGGLGAFTLDPERIGSNTSLSWTPGIGYRRKILHLELRDRMTSMDLANSDGRTLLHAIVFTAGVMFGL